MTRTAIDAPQLYCTFRLDGRLFGIDILDVKEVTTETACTRIAHAPDEVLGLVNIRGHIYLALDLRRMLGLAATTVTCDSRLLLFKSTVGPAFGVVVDEIAEIHTVSPDHIDSYADGSPDVLPGGTGRADLITAVCRLPDELLVVLNSRKLLSIVEQEPAPSA